MESDENARFLRCLNPCSFKELRQEWADSRFFLGKNSVMRIALGTTQADAYRPGLDGLAADVSGNVGLLLTSRKPKEVEQFFAEYAVEDYARAGFEATETVTVPAGRLEEMPHTMCETLRKLGMPVKLDKGTVVNTEEYTICTEGKTITPEQGRLLKMFAKQLAVFRVRVLSRWTAKTGKHEQLEAMQAFANSRWAKGGAGAGKAGAGAGAGMDEDLEEDDAE